MNLRKAVNTSGNTIYISKQTSAFADDGALIPKNIQDLWEVHGICENWSCLLYTSRCV